jgi:hypothetical protein
MAIDVSVANTAIELANTLSAHRQDSQEKERSKSGKVQAPSHNAVSRPGITK